MPMSPDISGLQLPLMVYDGECAFCRARIERWHEATGDQIHYVPLQEARSELSEIGDRELRSAIHFIDAGGTVSRGAEAVFRAMAYCGRKHGCCGFIRRCRRSRLPPSSSIA